MEIIIIHFVVNLLRKQIPVEELVCSKKTCNFRKYLNNKNLVCLQHFTRHNNNF